MEAQGNLQHLDESQRTKSEIFPKDREVNIKKLARKTNFRTKQDDGLEDDKQSVQDCPECTSRLIGHGTSSARQEQRVSIAVDPCQMRLTQCSPYPGTLSR